MSLNRRTVVAIAAGVSISGCLGAEETQRDTSDDGTAEPAAENNTEQNTTEKAENQSPQQVTDVELTKLRDFGDPNDEPNPSFRFGDYFGGTADRSERMVLMNIDGDVVWESEAINADYSLVGNFVGTSNQYYIWFIQDETVFVRAFDPDTGAELWTHTLVNDRNSRDLNEIVATERGLYYMTAESHNDEADQNLRISHINSGGEDRWSKALQQEGYGRALLAYENDLYVGVTRMTFQLDAQSGELVDTHTIRTSHHGFTRRSTDLYADTRQGLLKFDLTSSEIVWNNEDARNIEAAPVITEDLVLVPGEAGWIDAYAVSDGELRWETQLDQETQILDRTGNVLWTVVDEILYAYDLTTGTQIYSREDGRYGTIVSVDERISIVDYDEATLYGVEPISES